MQLNGKRENDDNFQVIGGVKEKQAEVVKRVLPEWQSNPIIISADLENEKVKISRFKNVAGSLDQSVLENLKNNGIKYFFPVQMELIPSILKGNSQAMCMRPQDLCVSAPTGSGKTLAYVIPMIQILKERVVCKIRALVVLPVKELALQVYKVFVAFAKDTQLAIGLAVGEKNLKEEQSSLFQKSHVSGYTSRIDILVATPGRLVDHLHYTKGFSLKDLRFIVLDEADRLMAESEYSWLNLVEKEVYGKIDSVNCHCFGDGSFSGFKVGPVTPCSLGHYTSPCQKLLFSATLSHNPEVLQRLYLFNPKLFTSVLAPPLTDSSQPEDNITAHEIENKPRQGDFVGRFTTPPNLKEFILPFETAIKPLTVWYLMVHEGLKHVLCFTNSVTTTHRLTALLKEMGDVTVEAFSSKMPAKDRIAVIKNFNDKKIDMLVCSDAMARGMDLENVDYVLCYDPPLRIETYVHRIGRTARAGKKGIALSLLDIKKGELAKFRKFMKTYRKVQVPNYPITEEKVFQYLEQFQSALTKVGQNVNLEIHTAKRKQNRYFNRSKGNHEENQSPKRIKIK